MFIYSLKASTVKFVAVLSVALVALITLIAFIPAQSEGVAASSQIDYSGIKTADDRVAFLGQFGWQVKPEPVACVEVKIPEAPGSAGKLKLHNVEPKTAAMLMAIVADKMGKPLNELRFISIKEVK